MKKRRILIVTNFYNPFNGMGKFIIDLSKILIKNNYNVIILTGKTDPNYKNIERKKGIIIIRSPISFKFSRGYFSIPLIINFIKLQKNVDIVHFQFPLVEILPLTLLTRKKKILQYHCLPAFVASDFKFIIAHLYFSFSVYLSMFFCNKIITFTNDYFFSKFRYKFFKNKTIEIFPFIKNENIIKNKQNIISEENKIPTFGFLGRICEEKGIEVIIKASKILESQNFKHKIFIAGDLKDKRFEKNINKLLNFSKDIKSIKFTGKLNEYQKKEFFEKIDILLLPSTNSFEAFGLVQLEAMNYGKLVISSKLKGVQIPVKLTGNGYVCKVNNSKDLANQMIKCIKLSKIKTKNQVFEKCNKIFNYDNSISEYLSVFEKN